MPIIFLFQSTSDDIFERSTPNELPIGAHYLRVKNLNTKDPNSVVLNYHQFEMFSYIDAILLSLLEAIAADPVYNILRNKEQLAYRVSFSIQNDLGIQGYTILVTSQETKFSAEYVDERIEKFRHEFLSIIERMPLNDFEMFKNSLAKSRWVEFDEGMNGYERVYQSEYTRFDEQSQEINYLMNITKTQLLQLYRTTLDAANQRKLSIQVIGNKYADESDSDSDDIVESFDKLTYANFTGKPKGTLIADLMAFRHSLEKYYIYKDEDEDEDDGEEYDDEEDEEHEPSDKEMCGAMLDSANARNVIHLETVFYFWFLYVFLFLY